MKFKLVKSADYKRGDLVLLEDGTEATIIGKSFGAGGVQTTDYYDVVTNDASEHQTEVHKSEIVKKITSKKAIKSGESYGWVVNPEDAWDKLWLFVDAVGEKEALEALARAMGNDELSDNLAYIFRMYDFQEGCSDYEEEEEEDDDTMPLYEGRIYYLYDEDFEKMINSGLFTESDINYLKQVGNYSDDFESGNYGEAKISGKVFKRYSDEQIKFLMKLMYEDENNEND